MVSVLYSYNPQKLRQSLSFFNGPITLISSIFQFPLQTVEMYTRRPSPAYNNRHASVIQSPHTPRATALPPIITTTIDESPEDHAVEEEMIDIGFYASAYAVDRHPGVDGNFDDPLSPRETFQRTSPPLEAPAT
jgi:hypothetical protein